MEFKVGEVAILQNCCGTTYLNGMECIIIGGLERRLPKNLSVEILCYVVEAEDGTQWSPTPNQLKRKPPKQDTTTWEEFKKVCGFDPSKVTV